MKMVEAIFWVTLDLRPSTTILILRATLGTFFSEVNCFGEPAWPAVAKVALGALAPDERSIEPLRFP
jgi:hypothetical protein